MEMFKFHKGYGQNFGYTIYRTKVPSFKRLEFESKPDDRVQVFCNEQEIGVLDWNKSVKMIENTAETDNNKEDNCVLQVIVENHGRINYTEVGSNLLNEQRKGLTGGVKIDGNLLKCEWDCYPLDFNKTFVKRLSSSITWKTSPVKANGMPALFRTTLNIDAEPCDTFLSLEGWRKGVAFVNGFNLGRYWEIGPTRTLFVPAPLLTKGNNEIMVFEQHKFGNSCQLNDTPVLQ